MARRKGCFGCLFSLLVTILVLIVFVLTLVWAFNNVTLNKLGLGDIEIMEGKTINDLGLGDYKIKDLLDAFKSLTGEVDESQIVIDPPTYEDKTITTNNLSNYTSLEGSGGEIVWADIIGDSPLYTESMQELVFTEQQIAVIYDEILSSASENNTLSEYNARVRSVKILSDTEGNYYASIVLSIDITEIKEAISSAIPFAQLGNTLYITANVNLSVTDEGVLQSQEGTISINGQSTEISNTLLNAILSLSGGENAFSISELNIELGNLFVKGINNLGSIGKITDNTSDPVSYELGACGLENGKITLITRAQ